MKEKALAGPGGKILHSLRIKWKVLYVAKGNLDGYVPVLLQGEHMAWGHPSGAIVSGR